MTNSPLDQSILLAFPNLERSGYRVTSVETISYNCIAHAAGDCDNWWWPVERNGVHWPIGVLKEVTLEAFIRAFETLGYAVCSDGTLEVGYEKVALYVESDAVTPTHAARQLPTGLWSSKLGDCEDIEHATPEALEGGYGQVSTFLKRRSGNVGGEMPAKEA